MTIIAWDGRHLAADKRSTDIGLARTTTKILRADCGALLGATGSTPMCRALTAWWKAGADPIKYPDKDNNATLIVIKPGAEATILMYDGGPEPIQVEESKTAFGSGRDYAIAAMYLGRNAHEAVEIASRFDTGCGNGIDVLMLKSP